MHDPFFEARDIHDNLHRHALFALPVLLLPLAPAPT
jgi:hypothetical protein